MNVNGADVQISFMHALPLSHIFLRAQLLEVVLDFRSTLQIGLVLNIRLWVQQQQQQQQ